MEKIFAVVKDLKIIKEWDFNYLYSIFFDSGAIEATKYLLEKMKYRVIKRVDSKFSIDKYIVKKNPEILNEISKLKPIIKKIPRVFDLIAYRKYKGKFVLYPTIVYISRRVEVIGFTIYEVFPIMKVIKDGHNPLISIVEGSSGTVKLVNVKKDKTLLNKLKSWALNQKFQE